MSYLNMEDITKIEDFESLLFTNGHKKEAELINQSLSDCMKHDNKEMFDALFDSISVVNRVITIKNSIK